jgi:hypothetical protein
MVQSSKLGQLRALLQWLGTFEKNTALHQKMTQLITTILKMLAIILMLNTLSLPNAGAPILLTGL